MNRLIIGGLALAVALSAQAQGAEADPFPPAGAGGIREERSYSKNPRHGYSGWSGPPIRGLYCDYRRNPIRDCKNGRCRVVKWELEQYCY